MPAIDRQPSDTPKSYAALCDLAAMGPTRSLEKYRQFAGKTPAMIRQLERWSSDHNWMARLAIYDASVAADESAARAAIRAARRAALEDRDWEQSNTLRAHLDALLTELPRFLRRSETETTVNGERVKVITLALNTSAGELARAMKLASELQRLSVGQATEQIDSNQTIEIRYVNDTIDDEAPARSPADDHD